MLTDEQEMEKLNDALNSGDDTFVKSLATEKQNEGVVILDEETGAPVTTPEPEETPEPNPVVTPEPEPEVIPPAPIEEPQARHRVSTVNLPADRQRFIELSAANPQMPLQDIQKIVESEFAPANAPSEPVADIDALRSELEEIQSKIIAKDEAWQHDDEWRELATREKALLVEVAEKTSDAKIAAVRAEATQAAIDREFASAEQEAERIIPDLMDENSIAHRLVRGRVEQIFDMAKEGRPLPVVEIDGVKHTIDPDSTNFPILVAHEQKSQIEKLAIAAKPVAPKPTQPVTRPISAPVPGGGANIARKQPVEGQLEGDSEAQRLANVKTIDDLNPILDTGSRGWRSSRAIVMAD